MTLPVILISLVTLIFIMNIYVTQKFQEVTWKLVRALEEIKDSLDDINITIRK